MPDFCKSNNEKMRRTTLCLPIHHQSDKNLESNDEYGCPVRQQRRSLDERRTVIISDPQHCSVSATLSLGRPKKLVVSKEKITETSAARATFQATTVTPHRQTFDDSKEVIASVNTPSTDQKLPTAKFKTEANSPSGNHSASESLNNSNNNNDNSSSMLQQRRSKTVPSFPTKIGNTETDSGEKVCSDTGEIDITSDAPCPDSPYSAFNSHESGGYHGDCSSVNSLQSTEYKDEVNRRHNNIGESRESLGSRLSRGFLEFTQGSSDRLQKWKNKLQNGRRHKDSSEPPPTSRSTKYGKREERGNLLAAPKRSTIDEYHY
uniref:Uncharacterized protein n=1 Tax=Setaria digitata TaxID=48799 RepID=A0A915PY93_9BILA